MAIGVGDVNLERAIGPYAAFVVLLAQRLQVGFPRVHIVNQQREMVTLGMRMHGLIAFANEMQLLRGAELIPRAREIKRRPRDRLQFQHAPVKLAALRHILHVQRHMIQLPMLHGRRLMDGGDANNPFRLSTKKDPPNGGPF